MRLLVLGANGMLGRALLGSAAHCVTGWSHLDCDITTPRIDLSDFDVAINAAAWTDVDGAEAQEETAFAVNAIGAGRVATACAATGVRLVHISTDYVFDGCAGSPYPEDAATNPVNAYGRSKAAGERAVLEADHAAYVVRTQWLFGRAPRNFVEAMARAAETQAPVDIVSDQWGSPTSAIDLADALVALAERLPAPGIYHVVNAGTATWYELAQAVFAELGQSAERVRPITASSLRRPATRPVSTVLGTTRWCQAGMRPLRSWREALKEYLQNAV